MYIIIIIILIYSKNRTFYFLYLAAVYTTETSDGEVHFEAPSNFSYECRTEEDITLYVLRNGSRDQSVIESVDISVWDVKIQAFEVPQTGVFSEGKLIHQILGSDVSIN